jgi:uncharacterized protein (TIGR02147 family)
MHSLTPNTNYRHFLRRELERRCQVNSRYSLTAFAKDLGLVPSRLSEVFSEKQGLSREAAFKIALKIGLTDEETVIFCDLVEMEHARSAEKRALAKIRLQERSLDFEYSTVEEDSFHIVSDWYHFAIVQLTELRSFRRDPAWISSKLNISRAEAVGGLDRLFRTGILVEEKGKVKARQEFIATTDNVPSEAIRSFHRQVLEKAASALGTQSPEDRNFSTNYMTIDKSDLPLAKDMLKKFRRKFSKQLDVGSKNKNSVYCLSMQFFALAVSGEE